MLLLPMAAGAAKKKTEATAAAVGRAATAGGEEALVVAAALAGGAIAAVAVTGATVVEACHLLRFQAVEDRAEVVKVGSAGRRRRGHEPTAHHLEHPDNPPDPEHPTRRSGDDLSPRPIGDAVRFVE